MNQLNQLLSELPAQNGLASLSAKLQEAVWDIVADERRRASEAEAAAATAAREARLLHETLQASLRVQEDALTLESRTAAELSGELEGARLDAAQAQAQLVELESLVQENRHLLSEVSSSSFSGDDAAKGTLDVARIPELEHRVGELEHLFLEAQKESAKAHTEKVAALAEAKREKLRAEWALAALEAIVEEIAAVRKQAPK